MIELYFETNSDLSIINEESLNKYLIDFNDKILESMNHYM